MTKYFDTVREIVFYYIIVIIISSTIFYYAEDKTISQSIWWEATGYEGPVNAWGNGSGPG